MTRRQAVTIGLALAAGGAFTGGSAGLVSAESRRQVTPTAKASGDRAATFGEQVSEDPINDSVTTPSEQIFAAIGAKLAPDDPPPVGEADGSLFRGH